MWPMIDRTGMGRESHSRAALVMAAVVGALFGGLAVGSVGLGLVSLTSPATSAVSGGVVIGVALILAVCLMWNLDSRAAARREDRMLAAEIGAARKEIAAARGKARKLATGSDRGKRSSGTPDF